MLLGLFSIKKMVPKHLQQELNNIKCKQQMHPEVNNQRIISTCS